MKSNFCNTCIDACDWQAIVIDEAGRKHVLVDRCDKCVRCLEECYAGALKQIGCSMTVDQVLALVEAERPFFDQSGGGITLSGGEPTFQAPFCQSVRRV